MPSLGGVTVLEVCEALDLRLLAGRRGADRIVTAVHVIELSEPWDHLAPGELVLSNGLWHDAVGTVEEYIEKLVVHEAAGMGYGLVDDGTEVPSDVIAACEAAGLALFEVPPDGRFVDISAHVFERAHERRWGALQQSLDRTSRMTAALASDGGLEGMLDVLSELLGRTVVLATAGGRVRYASGADAGNVTIAQNVRGWHVRSVGGGLRLLVRKARVGSEADDDVTLDQAAALIQVEMRRLLDNAAFSRRYLSELLRMVESDEQPAALAARCAALGLRIDRGVRFVVGMLEPVEGLQLDDLQATVPLARSAEGVVSIVAADQVDAVVETLRGVPEVSAVGVGEPIADAASLRRGLLQARRAARLASRLGEGTPPVLRHHEMRHHRLLLDAVGEDAVLSFRDAVLGPLIEYDETRDTDLVATLETFLTAIGGRLDTARELNIHQNTLRYRLARVEALTGTRLADISDRVDLYLALVIHRDHA